MFLVFFTFLKCRFAIHVLLLRKRETKNITISRIYEEGPICLFKVREVWLLHFNERRNYLKSATFRGHVN